MKALTVQNPWGWAIIHGNKLIENRSTTFAYRGVLLVHAGLRWSERGGNDPRIQQAWERAGLSGELDEHVTYGAIIGAVDLIDSHPDSGCCAPWGESSYTEHGGKQRTTVSHLILDNPRPLDPIPCKGRLGLWTPPQHIIDALPHNLLRAE